MVLQNIQLNHQTENFKEALSITRELNAVCRERIFFSHFANSLQVIELYDSKDNAPRELTTISGDLQRCLKMIKDPLEYEATLLFFTHYHDAAMDAFRQWRMENDSNTSTEDKLKLSIMKLVGEMAQKKMKAKENDAITIIDIANRVEKVKESGYNFSKYLKLIGIDYNDGTEQVDVMLKDLFKDGPAQDSN